MSQKAFCLLAVYLNLMFFAILKTDSDQAGSGEPIYSLQLSREHDKNQEHSTLDEVISS
jgi:hypothetical protein